MIAGTRFWLSFAHLSRSGVTLLGQGHVADAFVVRIDLEVPAVRDVVKIFDALITTNRTPPRTVFQPNIQRAMHCYSRTKSELDVAPRAITQEEYIGCSDVHNAGGATSTSLRRISKCALSLPGAAAAILSNSAVACK